MKYKVEVWRHHCLVVKIEADDTENIKDFVEYWSYMTDQGYCALAYYIDDKRLSIAEEIEFEREMKTMKYSCPEWVEALLWEIDKEMARVHWNIFQKKMDSPFLNTGSKYTNPIFEVSAYSWSDDDEDEVNFRYKDIEISWYKHLGRCTEININPKEKGFNEKMIDMFNECMKAVREEEE